MRQNYTFHRGVIDKDTDPRLVEPGKLLDVKNARVDGGKMIKEAGMLDLTTILEADYNLVGSAIYKEVVYVFSTNGTNSIISRYDLSSETYTILIQSVSLGLNINYPILDVDFVDDEPNDRLLMYWVDGLNEPRYINVTFAETDPEGAYSVSESFSVIKAPPLKEPDIVNFLNPEVNDNKLVNKCFRFAVRYVYKDGQTSTVSGFSAPSFVPLIKNTSDAYLGSAFNGVRISHEVLDLHHPAMESSSTINRVDFIAWEVNTLVMYKITSFFGVDNEDVLSYDFYNNEVYPVLDDSSFLSYSNVPKIANKQWLSENVLIYGDYTDGYVNGFDFDGSVDAAVFSMYSNVTSDTYVDNTTIDFSVSTIGAISKYSIIVFQLDVNYNGVLYNRNFRFYIIALDDYVSILDMFTSPEAQYYIDILSFNGFSFSSADADTFTLNASGVITINDSLKNIIYINNIRNNSSLKWNGIYQYGVVYFDKFDRRGDIELFPQLNLLDANLNNAIKPKVTINHTAPSWAYKFKIVRKEHIYGFQTVFFDTPSVYDDKIYLPLYEDDYDKISDTAKSLRVSTFSYGIDGFYVNIVKVETTDAAHALGEGKWIVVDDNKYDGYTYYDVSTNPTTTGWTNRAFDVDLGTDITTETYREYPETFFINNGYHTTNELLLDDQNQTATLPFVKTLTLDGDMLYGFGFDGLDNRYLIDVGKYYSPLGRAHLDADEFKEKRRNNSITYSTKTYVQDSGANGLSTFDLGQVNYKDYDVRYGKIQKIYGRDTDLIVFQDDKVNFQPFNKSLIQSVSADNTVVTSDKILGTHTAYVGEYGMSHPESFAFRDKVLFWVDAKRGVVMRLDVNGLFPISNNGLEDYWHSFFKNTIPVTMNACFDAKNMEYLLFNGNIVWAYSLENQGWSRYLEYQPDFYVYDGINVYSFKGDVLYKHHLGEINDYYGTVVDSEFQFPANKGFSDKKIASAVFLEGSAWNMKIEDSEARFTTIDVYEDKEGFLYAGVPMIESTVASQGVGGIGVCSDVVQDASITTMDVTMIPDGLSIGDNVYSGITLIGSLTNINENTLTLDGIGSVNDGDFVYYAKNSKLEGAPMRDHIFLVTMTSTGGVYADLFAVNIETIKSNS